MKKRDMLTRWIDANCGMSDPVEQEPVDIKTEKVIGQKPFEEIMEEFYNSFVGQAEPVKPTVQEVQNELASLPRASAEEIWDLICLS